jgi:hypothetical protein
MRHFNDEDSASEAFGQFLPFCGDRSTWLRSYRAGRVIRWHRSSFGFASLTALYRHVISLFRHDYVPTEGNRPWYCPSLTCSNHSTTLPSSFS